MCASVSEGKTVVVLAFIGKVIFGLLEISVEGSLTRFSGIRIERFLVKKRSDRERITGALLQSASRHVGITRGRPKDLALNRYPSPRLTSRDLQFDVPLKSMYDPHRFWYPLDEPASPLDNTVLDIACYDLPLTLDFYCYRLGMSLMAFRHLGVFVNAGAIPLHIVQVRSFLRDPDPIVECRVLDLYSELDILGRLNVYIEPDGTTFNAREGIFTHEDGALGAVIRDPDGNLLALRQETMKSKMKRKDPFHLRVLSPPGKKNLVLPVSREKGIEAKDELSFNDCI